MNFLLHHHLAALDLGSPAAAVGAMLPDLWRMADRRVRPARSLDVRQEGELGEVLAGVEHHLTIDRWFHDDPVFTAGERRAAELLREMGVVAPRIGLFAHVLWELCLDGELLRQVGIDAVLRALRDGFARVRAGAGARAAEIHHFERVQRSPADRAEFDRRMDRIQEEIARGPWIDGYQTGEGIAFRIQGVRAAFGLPRMEIEDHARLADVASVLLDEAPAVVGRILQHRVG